MDRFTVSQPLPGVYHIRDITGVCFTLVVGEKDTLLWDTGVGLFDVAECVAPYVRGRLTAVLSHAHHDHACGHHYFDEVFIHPDDYASAQTYTGRERRRKLLDTAAEKGYLNNGYDEERYLSGSPGTIHPLREFSLDLGGVDVQFLHAPGHTPGSMCAYLPRLRLLLTGDTWNPTTWLFFPESTSLAAYVQIMRSLRGLQAEHVLCSHEIAMTGMERIRAYIDGLNERTFAQAEPCLIPPYQHIHTMRCHPEPLSTLVFNGSKLT